MTATHTLQSVAKEAQRYFTRIARGEETITVFAEDRPEWLYDAVYEAHADMLPDDWKFEACDSALDAIADADEDADLDELAFEWADGATDVYNAARLKWLSSHMQRVYYVEEAAREFGAQNRDGEFDLMQLIGQGQYMEAREVFDTMRAAIEAEAERRNEEGDES